MLKKLLMLLLAAAFVSSYAQGMKRRPGPQMDGRRPAKHPLFAVLESDHFSPQERARLKALAAKDMKAFSLEMRKFFMAKRKAEATRILALRKQILEAKTPEEKNKLTAELRALLLKRADSRLAFHKKILDEAEQALQAMQNRCNQLKKEYNIRQKNKNAQVDRELNEILSANPPKHLEHSANWDPNKPMPPKAPRKHRR
ncbi:MAG: hypothetical protein IJW23_01390 [Lentisphaeria bacterium]|nr:hypothetical protein [Lentisphaeria bacterium]